MSSYKLIVELSQKLGKCEKHLIDGGMSYEEAHEKTKEVFYSKTGFKDKIKSLDKIINSNS